MKKSIYKIPDITKSELNEAIVSAINNYKKENTDSKHKFSRKRVLDIEKTIKFILGMQGGSLKKELYDANINVSPSAFVQQRNKLSWTDFENILECFNTYQNDIKKYKGYQVFAIDGTTVNMARNPKSESYMKPTKNNKGYNQLHANILYDIFNETYQHCMIQPQPKLDEIGALIFMLTWYEYNKNTLIIADRGYESYNLFAHFFTRNIDFLIRVRQDNSAMREIKKLPMEELDCNISFTITTTQTNVDKERNYIYLQTHKNENRIYSVNTRAGRWEHYSPYRMTLRVLRFQLDTGEYETLVTSLPNSFTLEDIKELYHLRWKIETSFRSLKYDLGLVHLHGKKDEYVKQEIYAAMIISNFASRIANSIALTQNKNNLYEKTINKRMSIYLCKNFFREENGKGSKLIQDLSKHTELVRPGRKDERNLKAKSFTGFNYRVFT